MKSDIKIGVVGLGYVGLPVALELAKVFGGTIGYDINTTKVGELKKGVDRSKEVYTEELESSKITLTSDIQDLEDVNFFIVCLPTPIDENNQPDLRILISACSVIGKILKPGATVVFESTVYPGVTENICAPVLEQSSGLTCGIDFKVGYSPERINPGDREHSLSQVIKVVAAQDPESLALVASVYGKIIKAGIHQAPSIRVAEAAKIIENTQRDINIALMNELAIIFDRLGIRTSDVLTAAQTKWNFLPFRPGLVGGHCIGVDPYYLTKIAQEVGYYPDVILSGRRVNDTMGNYVAQKAIKLAVSSGLNLTHARVGILGLTFKENIPDIRNSRVPEMAGEFREFGITPLINDPYAHSEEVLEEYGLALSPLQDFINLDILIIAVAHNEYTNYPVEKFLGMLKENAVLIDVKSLINPELIPSTLHYWSL